MPEISREQLLHVASLARLELREDEPHASLSVDAALANAPEREGNYFRVPPGGGE